MTDMLRFASAVVGGAVGLLLLCAAVPAAAAGADSVAEALKYDDSERALLAATVDGTGDVDGEAVSVLLGRAAMLPGEDASLAAAEIVPMANLLAEPAAFRGKLIHLNLYVWRWTPWTGATPSALAGKNVIRLDCTDRATKTPLILLVVDWDAPDVAAAGAEPIAVSATALYCKTVNLPKARAAEGQSSLRLYPVLVAKTLYGAGAKGGNIGKMLLAAGIVVLAFGYMMAKRAARKTPAFDKRKIDTRPATGDAPAGEVDKDLVREVRQHKARQQEGDDQ